MKINKLSVCILTVIAVISTAQLGSLSPSKASNEPPLQNIIREYTSVDLSKTLQDRVGVMRFQPTDASRLYAYALLAEDLAYQATKSQQVSAAAGGIVASYLVPSKPMTSEIGAFFSRQQVVVGDKNYNLGKKYADKIIAISVKDNYLNKINVDLPETKLSKSYQWVPTGTGDGALDPNFAKVKPLLASSTNCTIPAPTDTEVKAEGEAMYKDFDPAKAVGKDVLWWLAGVGTSSPSGYWLRITNTIIADNKISQPEASKIISQVAVADFDAAIMIWRYKYGINMLRPETLWKNLYGAPINKLPRDTPNHPSYPSGHSGFSAAAAGVLIANLGNIPIHDTLPPDLYATIWKKSWPSIKDAVTEASTSRINAGFHYPMDVKAGQDLGYCLGSSTAKEYSILTKGIKI